MKKEQFKVGDKVFAKVKGYPAWPAVILEENAKKYKVKFYGTGEIGQIKSEDLFYYTRYKQKLLKPSKRKDFNDSVTEIEAAISEAGTDGDPNYGIENDSLISDTSLVDSESSFSKKRKRSIPSVKAVEDITLNKAKKSKVSVNPVSDNSVINNESDVVETLKEEPDSQVSNQNVEPIENKPEQKENQINNESTENEVHKEITTEKEPKKEAVENDITFEETPLEEVQNEKPGLEDFVFEKELDAFIDYGKYVEKHEETYKKMPVQKRYCTKLQVLPVVLKDKCIGIKLHENWPKKKFTNEFEQAMYDKEIAEKAIRLKNSFKLDNLKESPDRFRELEISEEDLKLYWEKKLLTIKEDILENLKVEGKLIEIDSKIKSCLNLDKADPKEAINLLEQMLELDVTLIMLKKHAHVVDMVRRLKKYVGNLDSWSLTEKEEEVFKKDAEKVRAVAVKLHIQFAEIIGKPELTKSFWDHFNDLATAFRKETEDLGEMEFYLLTSWPYSRENFLHHYFVKDTPFSLAPQIETIVSKKE